MLKIFIFFVAEYTLSIVRMYVSWCDTPFIMEGIEDISSELLSANILSMTIALLSIPIAKCTGN
jgi:hypothetical protein